MKKIINVKNLTYQYKKDKPALNNLDFEVEQGEVFGFLGPNGSGKSTTQKVLAGILNGYGGFVEILGKEIRDWDKSLCTDIGVLFEFPYLYTSLSGIDNLKYFSSFYPKERRQDIDLLLQKLELKKGYAKKNVASYSKGMKQRINMARALINSPSILFLDEPTSGLDPAGAVLFRKIIKEQQSIGTTIFLTTHNMFDADLLCDRVAFISDGEIKAIDTPRSLKTQHSQNKVEVSYRSGNAVLECKINISDLKKGFKFQYDEILSVHSIEPSLEDVFIQYTGTGLQP